MNTLPPPAQDDNTPLKRCSACGNSYPATTDFFHRYARAKDGLQVRCKSCVSNYGKEYRNIPEVQDHRRELRRAYKKLPIARAHQRKYAKKYWKRPEVLQRKYWNRNPERLRAYYKLPHVRAKKNVYGHNRRARKSAVPGTLTPQQILIKLKAQKYRCYYAACGYAKFEKINGKYIYHLEHTVPLSRPEALPRHDVNYVVLSCPTCNRIKHNRLPHEWGDGGRLF
jgi:hypothetical protein